MGKNWVLIRGLARHSQHWGPFKDLFNQKFSTDHIEYLDLCGNGTEVDRASFLTIQDFTDDLRLRSKCVARSEKVNIVAISMGAMVAVDWAERYSSEVESITCINTSDSGSAHFWQRLRSESYVPLVKILINNKNQHLREKYSLDLITNIVENKNEIAKKFSVLPITKRSNFFRQIFAASKFKFPKQKPPCEVKLICSMGDRLVSYKCTENISQMWGLKPRVHPQAGHDLPLDAPEWLLGQIEK